MEQIDSITPAPSLGETLPKIIKLESKKYNLFANDNNNYELKMEAFNTEKLIFKIHQVNQLTINSYEKTFSYEEIAKILLLETNYYNNIQKVFKFCDNAFTKGIVKIFPEKENKRIKFLLKKRMDFEEVDCQFYLYEKLTNKDEIIQILIEEINEIKRFRHDNNEENNININNIKSTNDISSIKELNEKINKLTEKNELFEAQLNSIVDENNKLRNKIIEMEKIIQNFESKLSKDGSNSNKNEIIKEQSNSQNSSSNYIDLNSPNKLKFKEIITNNHSNSGWLRQFVVYKNISDNQDYLVINNKSNYNIDIYLINNKKKVVSLKGHKTKVSVIKYFTKNNRQFLLSCDENRIVFIWYLDTYAYILKSNLKMLGYVWDAAILLNMQGLDICIFPSNNEKECTRVYNINNNLQLISEINGTYTNKTNFVILWNYNYNYYLIELCSSKISINNIFKSEKYADLFKSPEGLHCCGYIYNDIYLCVTDYQNHFLRIWNLVQKSVEREINFEGWYSYGIIPWNNDYSIVACSEGLIVIDMDKGLVMKKIFDKRTINMCGIQKVNLAEFGESVICSNNNGSIMIFNEQ